MNGHFELGGVTPTRYFFSIAVVLGLLFALTSGEDDRSTPVVLLQWQLQAVVPMALLVGTHLLLLRNRRFAWMNRWWALAVSGAIGATLFAPLALAIEIGLESAARPPDLFGELLNEWIGVGPPVVISWVALNAPWILGYRLEHAAPAPASDAAPVETDAQMAKFMRLLPPEKRGDLLRLKSELHYLQVVTTAGSGSILYNLADAVAQLPPEQGMLVHRSHWVAFDAIEKLVRRGRQGELRLRDGYSAPVSRRQLPRLRQRLTES